MERIDYKRAVTRRWPVILVCAVIGAIVAVLIPVHNSPTASENLYQAQALASVSPAKDASTVTAQVSQVEFYSQQQPVYSATLKALKLKIGIQKLRSEIVLKTVKTKTKKTYPPGSFFIQAEQPTKDAAASMANQFVKQLAAYITSQLVAQRNSAIKQSTAEIASLNSQIASVQEQINALTKKPPTKSKTPPTTTTTKPKPKATTTTTTSTTTTSTTTTSTSVAHSHVVPNVTDDNIGGACAAIATQGLSCTPTSDDVYEYSSTVPNNTVITTDPPPGTVLPAGSLVKLVISRGAAPAGGSTTTTTATTTATSNATNSVSDKNVVATLLASTSSSTSTTSSSASKNQLAALQTKLTALQSEYSAALQHLQSLQNASPPASGLTLLAPARANQAKLVPGSTNPFAHRSVRGAAGLVGGALIGLAIALLLYGLDKRLRRADRVSEVFSLPVIAEVPKRQKGRLPTGSQKQSQRKKKGAVGTPQPVVAPAFLAVTDEPTSLAAEAYRRLRIAVMFEPARTPDGTNAPERDGSWVNGPDQVAGSADSGQQTNGSNGSAPRRQIVLVVSPTLEPTAPEVVANLAAAYAEAGQTALVVTTNDLRSKVGGYTSWVDTPEPPTIQTRVVESAIPPAAPTPGEPTQPLPVVGPPAVVRPNVVGRDARGRGPLTVEEVAAHCRPQQMHGVLRLELGELLAGPGEMATRGNDVLEATRHIAEIVLVEVPSLLATPDAEAVSRSADAIVVVAECYYTTISQATRSAGLLRRMGAPLLGVVLTAVEMSRKDLKKIDTSLPPANVKDAPAYAVRTGS